MNRWKFLFLEDSLVDLELIQRQLNRAKIDYYPIHVSDSEGFSQAILDQKPHLILSDFSLPLGGREMGSKPIKVKSILEEYQTPPA